jgi:DNA-binding Lrp family transcriptional regulator
MALSQLQRDILALTQFTDSLSANALAKRLKQKTHRIQYALSKLRASGILTRSPFIDIHRAGLRWCGIFLSLEGTERQQKAAHTYFHRHRRVGWFAELSGSYSIGLALAVGSPIDVDTFLKNLSAETGCLVYKKTVAFRTLLMDCPRQYLSDLASRDSPHIISDGVEPISLDGVDKEILLALTKHADASIRDLARLMGLPHSSLDVRVRKLRSKKILLGYSTIPNLHQLRRQLHKVLIYVSPNDSSTALLMRKFAVNHSLVSHYVESIGEWEYEMNIEVESLRDIAVFEQALRCAAAGRVRDTCVLNVSNVFQLRRWVGS